MYCWISLLIISCINAHACQDYGLDQKDLVDLFQFATQTCFATYIHNNAESIHEIVTSPLPLSHNPMQEAYSVLLHAAASCGNARIAALLIRLGAAVDSQDIKGYTPLHAAVLSKSMPTVTLLLDHRANINIFDTENERPLHKAVCLQSPHAVSLVQALLDHGADPNAPCMDPDGNGGQLLSSPLLRAAEQPDNRARLIISALLKTGANLHSFPRHPYRIIKRLTERNAYSTLELILSQPTINAMHIAPKGLTPAIFSAIHMKNIQAAHVLLNHGSPVDSKHSFPPGHPPLSALELATRIKSPPLVYSLLVAGAPITHESIRNAMRLTNQHPEAKVPQSSQDIAHAHQLMPASIEILEMLLDRVPDIAEDLVGIAALAGNKGALDLCIKRGYAMYEPENRLGWTSLHSAAHTGNDQAIEWLMRAGAYQHIFNAEGYLPIHLAAQAGNIRALGMLLKYGAHLDEPAQDTHPLMKSPRTARTLLPIEYHETLAHYEKLNMRIWSPMREFFFCTCCIPIEQGKNYTFLPIEIISLIYNLLRTSVSLESAQMPLDTVSTDYMNPSTPPPTAVTVATQEPTHPEKKDTLRATQKSPLTQRCKQALAQLLKKRDKAP